LSARSAARIERRRAASSSVRTNHALIAGFRLISVACTVAPPASTVTVEVCRDGCSATIVRGEKTSGKPGTGMVKIGVASWAAGTKRPR